MSGKKRTTTSTPATRRAHNVNLATSALASLGQKLPDGFDPKRVPSDRIAQNEHQALALMRAALGLDENLFTASMREIRAHVTTALRTDEIVDAELVRGGCGGRRCRKSTSRRRQYTSRRRREGPEPRADARPTGARV